jgi:hypothetical protein
MIDGPEGMVSLLAQFLTCGARAATEYEAMIRKDEKAINLASKCLKVTNTRNCFFIDHAYCLQSHVLFLNAAYSQKLAQLVDNSWLQRGRAI